MVRAGRGGELYDDFKKRGVVTIGWEDNGDFGEYDSLDKLKKYIETNFPEYKQGTINMTAGQLWRFYHELQDDDYVITYNPQSRIYSVGKLFGGYQYDPDLDIGSHYSYREVDWQKDILRDKLSTSTKNTLGAIMALFKLNEDAEQEILDIVQGKEPPDTIQDSEDEDTVKEDMIAKAQEFIKDKVNQLDWEEMQDLMAGVLRGMGYKTIVSGTGGADLGKDIIASPDGLGLEDPKILVEVKHKSDTIGAPDIRSFMGGLRQGNRGLYVSTGGFTKEAKYEAERSPIPVTLIDLDLLVNLLTQYYDNLDSDTKTLIPLTKIYWPA